MLRTLPLEEGRAITMHRRHNNAFTLIELLVALAVVVVLMVLLSLGMGKLNAATKSAKCATNLRTIGAATLSFGYEHNGYLMPHSTYGFWETSGAERIRKARWQWMTHLAAYLGSPDASGPMSSVFNCPADPEVPNWPVDRPYIPASASDKSHTLGSYGYNYFYLSTSSSWLGGKADPGRNMKAVTRPGKLLVIADRRKVGSDPIIRPAELSYPEPVHAKRLNAVFLDGHVESLRQDDVKTAKPYYDPK